MRSIFEYIDHRRFLSDYYREKKKTSRAFSYRYFCGKAGIKSPVFLKQVIDGERNLTESMAEKFLTAMQLSEKEQRYFRHLVLFNQAKTSDRKQEHYAVLRSMMNRVNERVLSPDLFDYFSFWYHPALRELVCLGDFRDDFDAIGRTLIPPISAREAKAGVKLLVRLGMIVRQADGSYRQKEAALATGNDIVSLAVRSFNGHMVLLAKDAIERFPITQRHVSGITLSCTDELYKAISEEVSAFKDRVVAMVNRSVEPHSRVYQLNVQLFPLSHPAPVSLAEGTEEPL